MILMEWNVSQNRIFDKPNLHIYGIFFDLGLICGI